MVGEGGGSELVTDSKFAEKNTNQKKISSKKEWIGTKIRTPGG